MICESRRGVLASTDVLLFPRQVGTPSTDTPAPLAFLLNTW